MSRVLNTTFRYTDKKQSIIGEVGKHGELVKASIFFGERAIVSLTCDMYKVRDFDGLMAINTQGELSQLIGIYFHGNLYPYSWKTLADDIVRLIHKGVEKGRSARVIFSSLKYVDALPEKGIEVPYLLGGKTKVFRVNYFGSAFVDGELANKALGTDRRFIEKQGKIIANQLGKGEGFVKFVSGKGNAMIGDKKTKAQLVSKAESHPVLVPIN